MNWYNLTKFALSPSTIEKAVKKFISENPKFISKNPHINIMQIIKYVNDFNFLQSKNLMKNIDIFKITFDELKQLINERSQVKTTTEKRKDIKSGGADQVFENDKVLVVSPKTHEASCLYGSGTTWCTTAKENVDWNQYYSAGVKLYYILPKDNSGKFAVVVRENGETFLLDALDRQLNALHYSNEIEFNSNIVNFDIPIGIFKPISENEKIERINKIITTTNDCPAFARHTCEDILNSGKAPKEWLNTINKHILEKGYPPLFAFDYCQKIMDSGENIPKEWIIGVKKDIARNGYCSGFAQNYCDKNPNLFFKRKQPVTASSNWYKIAQNVKIKAKGEPARQLADCLFQYCSGDVSKEFDLANLLNEFSTSFSHPQDLEQIFSQAIGIIQKQKADNIGQIVQCVNSRLKSILNSKKYNVTVNKKQPNITTNINNELENVSDNITVNNADNNIVTENYDNNLDIEY